MMSYRNLIQGLVLSGFMAAGVASANAATRTEHDVVADRTFQVRPTFSPTPAAAPGTEDHVVVGKRLQAVPSGSINDPAIGPDGLFRNGVMANLPTYG